MPDNKPRLLDELIADLGEYSILEEMGWPEYIETGQESLVYKLYAKLLGEKCDIREQHAAVFIQLQRFLKYRVKCLL